VELKWTEEQFADAKEGRLPMGKAPEEWAYGDLDAGFKNAALVLDETFVTPDTSHQTLETRTAMAYWQNGKLYMHTGTQSTAQTVPAIARWLNMDPGKVVLISEYTGGGFGSKITGGISADDPRAAIEESQRAGDDADQPRGRDIYRARAAQHFRARESRLLQRGPNHRARHVRDFEQRAV
jgi:xanthine dehydrogenase molybdopterin-binding subunit B